jgi:hypothetical protein
MRAGVRLAASSVVLGLVLSTSAAPASRTARGGSAAARRLAPPEPASRWYGWQTLASDALSVSTVFLGAGVGSAPLAASGVVGFALIPPILHETKGNIGEGFASFSMRVISVGLLVGGAWACQERNRRDSVDDGYAAMCVFGTIVGIIGLPTAIIVDASELAYEDVEPAERASYGVAPWWDRDRSAGGAALHGRF